MGWSRLEFVDGGAAMTLAELQQLIKETYDAKDRRRGVEGTFMWFMEEIGELATALRGGSQEERALEFADVLAWLATLANIAGIDLEQAVRRKYGSGCPDCGHIPCGCDQAEKP
jgi:NTP pyrophosphatase (non-canonical NTP hydrolase)